MCQGRVAEGCRRPRPFVYSGGAALHPTVDVGVVDTPTWRASELKLGSSAKINIRMAGVRRPVVSEHGRSRRVKSMKAANRMVAVSIERVLQYYHVSVT